MRPDMFKVIVERPRLRSRGPSALKARDDDETKVPMGRGRGTKELNENLAPLERFLRRNVGRPWNNVFSEICAGLSLRSAVQKHVRDHLQLMVDLHVFERNGELWTFSHGEQRLEPGYRDELYVCNRTVLLRVLPAAPRERPGIRPSLPPPAPPPKKMRCERSSPVTWVHPEQAALVFQDQWWLVTVRRVQAFPVWDVMLEHELRGKAGRGSDAAMRLYGNSWVAGIARRPLTQRELKKLGLERG